MKKRKLLRACFYVLICTSVIAPLVALTYTQVPAHMVDERRHYKPPFDPSKPFKPASPYDALYDAPLPADPGTPYYRGFADSYPHRTLDTYCHDAFVLAVTILTWSVVITFLALL